MGLSGVKAMAVVRGENATEPDCDIGQKMWDVEVLRASCSQAVLVVLETGQETFHIKAPLAMLIYRLCTEFHFRNPCCTGVSQSKWGRT